MDLTQLFNQLKAADIRLYLDNNQLRFSAPSGEFSETLKILVIDNKSNIINFLQEQDRKKLLHSNLPQVDVNSSIPLSSAQQRFWYLEQVQPQNKAWQLSNAFIINCDSTLDVAAFQASYQDMVNNTTLWKSEFTFADVNGKQTLSQTWQKNSHVNTLKIITLDESHSIESVQKKLKTREAEKFSLTNARTHQAILYIWPANHHQNAILYFSAHHIIADALSLAIFAKQLLARYSQYKNHQRSSVPELPTPLQYAQWAALEQSQVYKNTQHRLVQFWQGYLKNNQSLSLHRFKPSHTNNIHKRSRCFNYTLSDNENNQWQAFSQQQQCSSFIIGLALYQICLQRLCQIRQFTVGTAVSLRENEHTEHMFGPLINSLAINNTNLEGLNFSEYVATLQTSFNAAYQHRHLAFEEVVKQLPLSREVEDEPIFQTLYNFKALGDMALISPIEKTLLKQQGLHISPLAIEENVTQYRLQLLVTEDQDQRHIQLSYQDHLIDDNFAESLFSAITLMMRATLSRNNINDRPQLQDINILSSADIQHYIKTDYPSSKPKHDSFFQAFQVHANQKPQATAVYYQTQSLSYEELLSITQSFVKQLQHIGISSKHCIGVQLSPSLHLPALLLAINALGAHYSPVSTEAPKFRAQQLFKQAEANLIISDDIYSSYYVDFCNVVSLATLLSHARHQTLPNIAISAPDTHRIESIEERTLFAIFHTSGSTGMPKSVALSQAAMLNRLTWMQETFPLQKHSRVLYKADLSFDVSVWELFWPLITGHTLVIAEQACRAHPEKLQHLIHQRAVTHCHFVPSLLQDYLSQDNLLKNGSQLNTLFCSGESLSPNLLEQSYQHFNSTNIVNLYGPTEAAIDVSYYQCSKQDTTQAQIPIGKKISGMQLYIADENLSILPLGASGEILIAGDNLAEAYVNNQDENQKSFYTLKLPSQYENTLGTSVRVYRSGDYGRYSRYNDQLELIYLGRQDQQIKLRGQRIELQEINFQLEQHPSIKQAYSLLSGNQIISYYSVIPSDETTITPEALKQYLLVRLPSSYCPNQLIALEHFPLLHNGKVNKKQLPQTHDRQRQHYFSQAPWVGASSEIEKKLVSLWEELLEVDIIGIYDNFFILGGHSILAMQMLHRCQALFDVNLPPNTTLKEPTIKALAQVIQQAQHIQQLQAMKGSNTDNSTDEEEFIL